MFNKNLFAKKLQNIEPYKVDTGSYRVRLDANESFISLPENIRQEIAKALSDFDYNRYPDPSAEGIRKAFASYYGIDSECVGVGNGSDEIISLLMNCFLDAGSGVMTFSPDFSMYAFYATLAGMKSYVCKKNDDYSVNFECAAQMLQENDIKLVIFSNPCNPTGKIEKKCDIEALAKAFPDTVFVVDEAYMDFACIKDAESFLSCVGDYSNIVVLKTLSKALGAASLRLGFIIADKVFVDMYLAVKSPYNVNGVSQKIGEILLSDGKYLDECTKRLCESAQTLRKTMIEEGLASPDETYTNFVFYNDADADKKQSFMKENGVLVRKFAFDGGAMRITAGDVDENKAVTDLLKTLK